jgi:PhnB protein
MLRISPHLTYDGQCRAAFERYRAVLGGTLTTIITYGESPLASQFEPRWHDRILHATLALDGLELLGADELPDRYRAPQGIFIGLTLRSTEHARQVFEGLAQGGRITLPFQRTFWATGFGMLVDAFGIPWEVSSNQAPALRPVRA